MVIEIWFKSDKVLSQSYYIVYKNILNPDKSKIRIMKLCWTKKMIEDINKIEPWMVTLEKLSNKI